MRAFTVDRFFAALGAHAEDFLGDVVLDQFCGRRFVEDGDRALLDQALEQFPGVGIAVGRAVWNLCTQSDAGQIGEFDADRRMLVLLRIAAEAFEPSLFWHISSAHTCTIGSGTV